MPLPPYVGVRFSDHEPIDRFVVTGDGFNATLFFAGFYPDTKEDPGLGQLTTWTHNPRYRREYETYEEAMIEGALIISLQLVGDRNIEIVRVRR